MRYRLSQLSALAFAFFRMGAHSHIAELHNMPPGPAHPRIHELRVCVVWMVSFAIITNVRRVHTYITNAHTYIHTFLCARQCTTTLQRKSPIPPPFLTVSVSLFANSSLSSRAIPPRFPAIPLNPPFRPLSSKHPPSPSPLYLSSFSYY